MTSKSAQPHITVVIPTRERADVLAHSLRTCRIQDYDKLTILVSDNCSNDHTKEVALSGDDPRINYVNTGRRLSMSGNYEFALSQVEDGWVTIIGDDDGLLPNSVAHVADLISETKFAALRSATCIYRWPSLLGTEYGKLTVPLRSGYEVRNSRLWLSSVLRGRALYQNLPMLYSGGFVEVATLKRIAAVRGSFYQSCIPDVYSAMAIARTIDEYIYIHEPLAIDGVSAHSTGTSLVKRGPTGPAEAFLTEENIPFHPDVPTGRDGPVPRVYQAWIYESYLQSAYLGDGSLTHHPAEQITIALASPACDRYAEEWARKFASQHQLDFSAIQRRARRQRLHLALREKAQRIARALNTHYDAGDATNPLGNVYDASLTAAAIRNCPPSRTQNVRNLARIAFARALGYRECEVSAA